MSATEANFTDISGRYGSQAPTDQDGIERVASETGSEVFRDVTYVDTRRVKSLLRWLTKKSNTTGIPLEM
jgi:hypothetical protein